MSKKVIRQAEESTDHGLLFDIFDIANKGPGAEITYDLEGIEPDFSKYDVHVKGPIEGKLEIMKIENEYNVAIKGVKMVVELICEKCLEKFEFKVEIPYAESQFQVADTKSENSFDSFYVDTKNHQVDIEEFLRQEIILHFPLVAVCSPHCKGINLN